ncbi:MAG: methyltransferase domain-containing protein [Candidatus Bathyarchaeia archaeon]
MSEWNRILLLEEYSSEQPAEIVANIVKLLKKRENAKVLDLGCGAGRNMLYVAAQGFETYGLDISETGLKETRERLEKRRLEGFSSKR